jgi:hypothetical protein
MKYIYLLGHFQINLGQPAKLIWTMVFMLMTITFFIYFFNSSFIGVYLESFRISSMRKGYSFDRKDLDTENLMNMVDIRKHLKNVGRGNKNKKKKENNNQVEAKFTGLDVKA